MCVSGTGTRNMLKLRSIGIQDYSVFENKQRIGRIRFADEHVPGVWLWNINVHLTGDPWAPPRTSTRPRRSSKRRGKL